jgi:hypothetical protein
MPAAFDWLQEEIANNNLSSFVSSGRLTAGAGTLVLWGVVVANA